MSGQLPSAIAPALRMAQKGRVHEFQFVVRRRSPKEQLGFVLGAPVEEGCSLCTEVKQVKPGGLVDQKNQRILQSGLLQGQDLREHDIILNANGKMSDFTQEIKLATEVHLRVRRQVETPAAWLEDAEDMNLAHELDQVHRQPVAQPEEEDGVTSQSSAGGMETVPGLAPAPPFQEEARAGDTFTVSTAYDPSLETSAGYLSLEVGDRVTLSADPVPEDPTTSFPRSRYAFGERLGPGGAQGELGWFSLTAVER